MKATTANGWVGEDSDRERALTWIADQLRWEGVLKGLREQLKHGPVDADELAKAA